MANPSEDRNLLPQLLARDGSHKVAGSSTSISISRRAVRTEPQTLAPRTRIEGHVQPQGWPLPPRKQMQDDMELQSSRRDTPVSNSWRVGRPAETAGVTEPVVLSPGRQVFVSSSTDSAEVHSASRRAAETEIVTQPDVTSSGRWLSLSSSSGSAQSPADWDSILQQNLPRLDEELFTAEPAAEPDGWMEEPSSFDRPMSETLCAALVLVMGRLVWRVQRESLQHWHQVAQRLPSQRRQELSKSPRIQVADAVAAAQDALAFGRATRALATWHGRSQSRRAQQAVMASCDGYHAQVLLKRSLASWVKMVEDFCVAKDLAQRLYERLFDINLEELADRIMEAWRRHALDSSLRRRGEQALTEWIRSKCLRSCTLAWLTEARRSHTLRIALDRRQKAMDHQLGLRFCNAWQRIAGLERLAGRRFEAKLRRQGEVAWEVWQRAISRSKRGGLMAQHRLHTQNRRFLKAWERLYMAAEASTRRLVTSSFQTWHRMLMVLTRARKLILDIGTSMLSDSMRHWKDVVALEKRASRVSVRIDESRLQRALQQWAHLHKAENMVHRSLAHDCLKVWRAHATWFRGVRRRLQSHDHGLLEEAFQLLIAHCHAGVQQVALAEESMHALRPRRCVLAIKWWSDWASKERRSAQQTADTMDFAHRQSLRNGIHRWHNFSSNQRARASREASSTALLRDQAAARALWSWRAWAETHVSHREHLHRATLALRAMLATSQWTSVSETYSFWSGWAKRKRRRKGLDLSTGLTISAGLMAQHPGGNYQQESQGLRDCKEDASDKSVHNAERELNFDALVDESESPMVFHRAPIRRTSTRMGFTTEDAEDTIDNVHNLGQASQSEVGWRPLIARQHPTQTTNVLSHDGPAHMVPPEALQQNISCAGSDGLMSSIIEEEQEAEGPMVWTAVPDQPVEASASSHYAVYYSMHSNASGQEFQRQPSPARQHSDSVRFALQVLADRNLARFASGFFRQWRLFTRASRSFKDVRTQYIWSRRASVLMHWAHRTRCLRQGRIDAADFSMRAQSSRPTPTIVASSIPTHRMGHRSAQHPHGASFSMSVDNDSTSMHGYRDSPYGSSPHCDFAATTMPTLSNMSSRGGTTLLPASDQQHSEVMLRWLRWTLALWLGAAAALPWLQWAFALWRGGLLRAELLRLRWWSMSTRRGAMRQIQLRRLRCTLHAWGDIAHRMELAVVHQPLSETSIERKTTGRYSEASSTIVDSTQGSSSSNLSQVNITTERHSSAQDVQGARQSIDVPGVQGARCKAALADDGRCESQEQHPNETEVSEMNLSTDRYADLQMFPDAFIAAPRVARRYERVSEAAWCCRLEQLAVFVAWAGAAQRSTVLHTAVTPTNLCDVEFVLCTFSAWVLLTRRSRDAAQAAQSTARLRNPGIPFGLGLGARKQNGTSTTTTTLPRCSTRLPEGLDSDGAARYNATIAQVAASRGRATPIREPPVHRIVSFSKRLLEPGVSTKALVSL